jgi:fructose-specific phosphotransferase system component IIB
MFNVLTRESFSEADIVLFAQEVSLKYAESNIKNEVASVLERVQSDFVADMEDLISKLKG